MLTYELPCNNMTQVVKYSFIFLFTILGLGVIYLWDKENFDYSSIKGIRRHGFTNSSTCSCILVNASNIQAFCRNRTTQTMSNRTIYLITMGRLGNVLFQIAGAYAIAKETNSYLAVAETGHLDALENKPFRTTNGAILKKLKLKFIDARHKLNDFLNAFVTAKVESFKFKHSMQRYMYFGGCANEIRNKLTLKKSSVAKADQTIRNLIKHHLNSTSATLNSTKVTPVGIHIRRGDIVNGEGKRLGYRAPNTAYFNNAMNYFKQRYPEVIFIVATDSKKWVQKFLLKPGMYFSPLKSPVEDMALLSKCDHVITSLGTFSWWAGFYSHGTVIYYKNWVALNSALWKRIEYDESERFPPGWIAMT